MQQILLENCRIFDGVDEDCPDGMSVLVEGGLIGEVSAGTIGAPDARPINVDGDPLRDIGLLARGADKLRLVMRSGELVKGEL